MTQVIVELDDQTMKRLDLVAPARARKRSEFIREAIRRALNDRLEAEMARAYAAAPQDEIEVDIDPSTWSKAPAAPKKRRSR